MAPLPSSMTPFALELAARVQTVEAAIDRLLPSATTRPSRLHEAMRYSLQAGGKRLRPMLVLAAAEAVGGRADPLPAAVAIECVHTYSLIHDDLPCMDNDDFRRGRPTSHRQFDEPTALLAGDALLTYAFELLTASYAHEPIRLTGMVTTLAHAAGSQRLIGGQMEDLLAERTSLPNAEQLDYIHLNKTAAMIEAALLLGVHCGPTRTPESRHDWIRFGRELGLTFQIVDDILDATQDSQTLGKTAGKDARADKTTYVKLHGLDGARREAERHTEAAHACLAALPGDKAFLHGLVEAMLNRRN